MVTPQKTEPMEYPEGDSDQFVRAFQGWLRSGASQLECEGTVVVERSAVDQIGVLKYVPQRASTRLRDCVDFANQYFQDGGWSPGSKWYDYGIASYCMTPGYLDWFPAYDVEPQDKPFSWDMGCWNPSLDQEERD